MEGEVGLLYHFVGFFLYSSVLVFTIISTPYRIAFYDFDGLEWVIIEILVDLSFLLDMIFNFRAAYFNSQDQLIDDLPTIACTYLKGWFLVDFVAIFPLNHILKSIRSSGSTLNQLARLARLPRLYKILQFSRYFPLISESAKFAANPTPRASSSTPSIKS